MKVLSGTTYGLGMDANSSYELTRGDEMGTFRWYGRRSGAGLCDRPRARSLNVSGGAKSLADMRAKVSSPSLAGLGSVVSAGGGAMGGRGLPRGPMRADADESGRGPRRLEVAEPGRNGDPPPGMLMPPIDPCMTLGGGGPRIRGPRGGGVMARRCTGWAYGMTNDFEPGSMYVFSR